MLKLPSSFRFSSSIWSTSLVRRSASRLIYSEHGDPGEVLRLDDFDVTKECNNVTKVLVKLELATVNPADVNMIEGKYPIRPSSFPATPGIEGVGRVLRVPTQDVENKMADLSVGDRVMLLGNEGSWTSHVQVDPHHCFKVENQLSLECSASLRTNMATAYRLLKDFIVDLKPGDVVVQNGGNSAVGQFVIMIAKSMGLRSVSVVRERDNLQELKQQLKDIGATYVLTEKELRKGSVFRDERVPKARLALNCVGGESATELSRWLDHKGVHVTYGGMSKKPVTLNTASLIFKDIRIRGFWLTQWYKEASREAICSMIEELTELCIQGKIRHPRIELVQLDQYQSVMERYKQGYQNVKFVFDLRDIQ